VTRPPRRHTFLRSNLVSLFTTTLDFATLLTLAGVLGVEYVLATWIGTVVGSTTNFLINKRWTFRAGNGAYPRQLGRFALVQAGASALHTGGVWALTGLAHLHYALSKAVVALVVYLAWNYPLNRCFVFRGPRRASAPPARDP
jgi:putative flippase GtrA